MSMLTVVIRRLHKMGVHKMGVVGGFKNPVGWRKEADSYSYHPWEMSDQKSILHTWTDTNSSLHRLPGSGLMSPRDKILSTIQPTIRSYLWGGGKKQTATDLPPPPHIRGECFLGIVYILWKKFQPKIPKIHVAKVRGQQPGSNKNTKKRSFSSHHFKWLQLLQSFYQMRLWLPKC